jgi:hypothetical protein
MDQKSDFGKENFKGEADILFGKIEQTYFLKNYNS